MANCFGDVVDNYMLDTMPRYVGLKKTQEDRAREAALLSQNDGKLDKAKDYVDGLKRFFGNGVTTLCLVYNQTGGTLRYVDDRDWFGSIGTTPYPTEIGNGQWASFLHVKRTAAASGSTGAVVYRGRDGSGRERDFMLGWSAPWGAYRNKAYCEIGNGDSFQSRWGDLYNRVSNADYHWTAREANCSIEDDIDRGTSPYYKAYIKIPYRP